MVQSFYMVDERKALAKFSQDQFVDPLKYTREMIWVLVHLVERYESSKIKVDFQEDKAIFSINQPMSKMTLDELTDIGNTAVASSTGDMQLHTRLLSAFADKTLDKVTYKGTLLEVESQGKGIRINPDCILEHFDSKEENLKITVHRTIKGDYTLEEKVLRSYCQFASYPIYLKNMLGIYRKINQKLTISGFGEMQVDSSTPPVHGIIGFLENGQKEIAILIKGILVGFAGEKTRPDVAYSAKLECNNLKRIAAGDQVLEGNEYSEVINLLASYRKTLFESLANSFKSSLEQARLLKNEIFTHGYDYSKDSALFQARIFGELSRRLSYNDLLAIQKKHGGIYYDASSLKSKYENVPHNPLYLDFTDITNLKKLKFNLIDAGPFRKRAKYTNEKPVEPNLEDDKFLKKVINLLAKADETYSKIQRTSAHSDVIFTVYGRGSPIELRLSGPEHEQMVKAKNGECYFLHTFRNNLRLDEKRVLETINNYLGGKN